MYEVRNIAFTYRERPVLRDVSFVVSPGETVAVVGDNGAGKTTLLRVLATLAEPDSGRILVEGRDALSDPLKYRRLLGYLPERPALYGEMQVKRYLRYRAELKGELGKRIRRRVSEAAEICRLGTVMDSRISTLSAGQKQRVALADALLLRPRVLLLDDFLTGLDVETRNLMGLILSTVASFSSVIVTGHEIDELAKWTTRFLVLKNGIISTVVSAAGVEPQVTAQRVKVALGGLK